MFVARCELSGRSCDVAVSRHRGSALQKRLRDREKEMEVDERDRKREKEELEEIRQRLLAEGHPDPDAELQRVSVSTCAGLRASCIIPVPLSRSHFLPHSLFFLCLLSLSLSSTLARFCSFS